MQRITGAVALLTAGPPAGTPVVTVGAAELWAPSSASRSDGGRPGRRDRCASDRRHPSLRFRFLVVALAAALMLLRAAAAARQPVDVFPEFAPPRVEIQTACLGLSAEEVEELVTVPLEQALNGVPGSTSCARSRCRSCRTIVLIFEPAPTCCRRASWCRSGCDRRSPTLPTWAAPPVMMQPLSSTSRVMKIGLSSKTHVARWTCR